MDILKWKQKAKIKSAKTRTAAACGALAAIFKIMVLFFKRFKIFSKVIALMFLQACAVDPPVQRIDCKIAINKEYRINTTKHELITKFKTNPSFINIDNQIKDSIFYFDVTITDKWSTFGYKTTLIQKNNDTLILTLDSIVDCWVRGKPMSGVKPEYINFCKSLKNDDFVRYFNNIVINRLENKDYSKNESVILNFMY